jgi:hypothetical protein
VSCVYYYSQRLLADVRERVKTRRGTRSTPLVQVIHNFAPRTDEMSAVDSSASTIVAAQRSSVPSGVRVTWSQRRDTVIVAVEFPSDSEEPQVSFSDCGLVAVQAAAAPSGERWDVQLQCSHKIDAVQSRRLCPHRPHRHTRGQLSKARHVQERQLS